MAGHKPPAISMMPTECDCGFEFRRKAPVPVAVPVKESPAASVVKSADKRRRRSSFAAAIKSTRPSSFHLGITQSLPGLNVAPQDLHKHILPDLPGPLKMKQLLIWAAQMASGDRSSLCSAIVEAVLTNRLNTSWYQRPLVTVTNGQARANPLNQEWLESMAHYERLLGMYAAQLLKIILCSLQAELGVWKEIEGGGGLLAKITALPDPPVQQSSLELVGTDAADALMQWFTDLPISLDRLQWALHVCGGFEAYSKQFCENVFSLIFRRFFSNNMTKQESLADPRMVLQALSFKNRQ